MKRAVVLGGGGPVGIAWQAGFIVGLSNVGVDLSQADLVVGTSAGSVVGLLLSSGGDLSAAIRLLGDQGSPGQGSPNPEGVSQSFDEALLNAAGAAAVAEAAGDAEAACRARAALGQQALSAQTMSEAHWKSRFDLFSGVGWPNNFRCCAVDADDGTFRVWGPGDSVPAREAVASSCAVPLLYPPVSMAGRRWIDGGVRDMLNADVAAGADVAVVVSCTLLELPWQLPVPYLEEMLSATRRRVEVLGSGAEDLVTVVPSSRMLEVSEWGLALMDFARAGAAYDAGLEQAGIEADRLQAHWGA
ncbi:MAG: patatin-like phospholipase family protein [Acidimicrobiales bacterium]